MKLLKTAALVLTLFLLGQAPASAQVTPADVDEASRLAYAAAPKSGLVDPRAIGAGLVIIGAGIGIGWIAASAVSAMARQPEVAGNIQTAMIIAAALIEGVAFFALIIVMLFASPY